MALTIDPPRTERFEVRTGIGTGRRDIKTRPEHLEPVTAVDLDDFGFGESKPRWAGGPLREEATERTRPDTEEEEATKEPGRRPAAHPRILPLTQFLSEK